jgi:hypothetical protein
MKRSDLGRLIKDWEHDKPMGRSMWKIGCSILALVFVVTVVLALFTVGLGFIGLGTSTVNRALEEAGSQFDRYQQFKDLAAAIDALGANIDLQQARLAAIETTPRSQQDRFDKQEGAQVRAELIGVRSKYNAMAAQYNAAMAKINYRYANIGMMPEGAEPLPREFRTYER